MATSAYLEQGNKLISPALWVKFSADNTLKYFSDFFQKTGFDSSCKLSPKDSDHPVIALIKALFSFQARHF